MPTLRKSQDLQASDDIIRTSAGMIIINRTFLILTKSIFSDQVFKQVTGSLKKTFPELTASWIKGFKRIALTLGYSDQDLWDAIFPFTCSDPFPCFIPAYRHFMKPVSKVPLYSHYDVEIHCSFGGMPRSTFGIVFEDEKGPLFALTSDIKKFDLRTLYQPSINSYMHFH